MSIILDEYPQANVVAELDAWLYGWMRIERLVELNQGIRGWHCLFQALSSFETGARL